MPDIRLSCSRFMSIHSIVAPYSLPLYQSRTYYWQPRLCCTAAHNASINLAGSLSELTVPWSWYPPGSERESRLASEDMMCRRSRLGKKRTDNGTEYQIYYRSNEEVHKKLQNVYARTQWHGMACAALLYVFSTQTRLVRWDNSTKRFLLAKQQRSNNMPFNDWLFRLKL